VKHVHTAAILLPLGLESWGDQYIGGSRTSKVGGLVPPVPLVVVPMSSVTEMTHTHGCWHKGIKVLKGEDFNRGFVSHISTRIP